MSSVKGDFIIEYLGRKAQEQTLDKNGGNGVYYMQVWHITINCDMTSRNDAKFINHSCSPNCGVLRVQNINGKDRVFLFALRRINKK